jgi:plasmid maintenance system antidote protein VapI
MSTASTPKDLELPVPKSPGEIMLEVMKSKNLNHADVAKSMGWPVVAVYDLVHRRIELTDEVAEGLGRALGQPARWWKNHERDYRVFLLTHLKQYRHGIVRDMLRPGSCRCFLCSDVGTGTICRIRGWVPPPRLQLKPPRTVKQCEQRYQAAERTYNKIMETPGSDWEQAFEQLALTQEFLLIWLAERIYKLPGQPNSMDNYMLVDFKKMLEIYRHYSKK